MKFWIILIQDPISKIVTDIVALSDFNRTTELATEYRKKAGRNNVTTTQVTVDELPEFIGLVKP